MPSGRTWRHRKKSLTVSRPDLLLDTEYIELLKWAKQSGIKCKSLMPALFQATGRGMLATRKIKNGDCIIEVPKKLLLTTSTALSSDFGKMLNRNFKGTSAKLSHKCILCLYIAYLKYGGKKSFWFPYIETLPKYFNTPCYFDEEELKALPKSSHEQCFSQMNEVQHAFNLIQHTYKDKFQNMGSDFLKFLTFDDFKWAWFVVNTRSVYLATGEEKCSCCYDGCCLSSDYALAPVLDLLNHQDTAVVSAGFNPVTQVYQIHTATEYPKHSQVFINYGPHDNTTLLVEYGFILPKNIHNVYKFKPEQIFQVLKLDLSDFILKKRMNLIKRNDLERDFSCAEDDGVSWSLLVALRLLALEEDMLDQWNKVLDGKPFSRNSEIIVQKWILLILSHSLENLESENHREKWGICMSANMQLAMQLHEQEKQILRTALTKVDILDSYK